MWQLRTAGRPSLPATPLIGFRPRRRVKFIPSPATESERGWEGTLSGERVERRLTALLAADVAGYSRLMGADVEGALAAPKAIRRELVDPSTVCNGTIPQGKSRCRSVEQ